MVPLYYNIEKASILKLFFITKGVASSKNERIIIKCFLMSSFVIKQSRAEQSINIFDLDEARAGIGNLFG